MASNGTENNVEDDLRAAWRGLIVSGRTGTHGLPPLRLPYYLAAGAPEDPLLLDVDEDRSIAFTAAAVSRLKDAADRWAESGWALGRVDGYELMRAILDAAAATVGNDADVDLSFDTVVKRRWASVVAVPIGGAFLLDGPEQLGHKATIGHVDRDTERAIADLALRWHPPLGGFQFNHEVSWTEDFLAAENDSHAAAEIEQQLDEEAGWMPLVLAVALDTVGARADVEAFAVSEALARALHLLARYTHQSERARVLMPWVLDLGPSVAYFPNDGELPAPNSLRLDTCGRASGHPETSRWVGPHRAVDVRDLIERGYQETLTAVVDGALERVGGLDARGGQGGSRLPASLAGGAASGDSARVAAAASAASAVSPDWQERGFSALVAGEATAWPALIDGAVEVVTTALLDLV